MEQVVHNIETCLQRTWEGLRITVKIPLLLEEFFRTSSGTVELVSDYGRLWRPTKSNADVPLKVHGIGPELSGPLPVNRTSLKSDVTVGFFRLDSVSGRITSSEVANLAFLRLVGAGGPDGVTFVVPGVYSEDTILQTNRNTEAAIATFCRDFVKPIKVTSVISLVEQKGGSNEFQEVRQIG